MWRVVMSVGLLAIAVAGIYRLMVWDAHFLLTSGYGAACGGFVGFLFSGRRAAVPGAGVGFVALLLYFPLWFVLNLPPRIALDL